MLASLRTAHRWAIAAAVPLIVALSIGYAISIDRVLATEAGEWRIATVADGTLVRAGPRTRLHFDFTDRQRHIRLVRSEAMFYVAKDTSRPLLVQTELATA